MTNDELNKYILHYLTEDKTNSAIMLTGAWGTGKSYYIQHTLTTYLQENGDHPCIVVSLYGIKDTVEISKAIYMACRLGLLTKEKHEGVAAALAASKTIIKGVTSFFGIDLSQSDENMESLFESIDLTGKLIVLEDLERSGIDILEVLGYVNGMVEQDGVKVLLVANEEEILQFEQTPKKDNSQSDYSELLEKVAKQKTAYTETTRQYLRTKEKTVSDTIGYEGELSIAIREIISGFNNDYLNLFSSEECIAETIEILQTNKITNLRTVVFACQKAVDIFSSIKPDTTADADYIKTIFYGILVCSQKLKNGKNYVWKSEKHFSAELATEKYPLLRACYNYIKDHYLDRSLFEEEKEELKNYRLYNRSGTIGDEDVLVLYSWWLHSEAEVKVSVRTVIEKLKSGGPDGIGISYYAYGSIAYCLTSINSIIDIDYAEAKQLLVSNLKGRSTEVDSDYLFSTVSTYGADEDVLEAYESLKDEMIKALSDGEPSFFGFDYQTTSISELYDTVYENSGRIIHDGTFAARLNIVSLCEMIKQCSPLEIDTLWRVFAYVYQAKSIRSYLGADKEAIDSLLTHVMELRDYNGFDKIQLKQLGYLISTLTKISEKLIQPE